MSPVRQTGTYYTGFFAGWLENYRISKNNK